MTAAHMELVRAEYERTKADHAHIDGCDDCGTGLDPRRPAGWEFSRAANVLLCGPCVAETLRVEAQLMAARRRSANQPEPREVCGAGHRLGADNLYVYVEANGKVHNRCRACGRARNAEARARKRAAK